MFITLITLTPCVPRYDDSINSQRLLLGKSSSDYIKFYWHIIMLMCKQDLPVKRKLHHSCRRLFTGEF